LGEKIFRGQRIERGGLFLRRGHRVKNSCSLRVSWWKGFRVLGVVHIWRTEDREGRIIFKKRSDLSLLWIQG
jgi:hypothetical protein